MKTKDRIKSAKAALSPETKINIVIRLYRIKKPYTSKEDLFLRAINRAKNRGLNRERQDPKISSSSKKDDTLFDCIVKPNKLDPVKY